MGEIIIGNLPLKDFLKIFAENDHLRIIELGDTWHPASGFVDQTYFENITTVGGLLKTDYDFRGLVIFIAEIKGLRIDYHGDSYKISGDRKEIEKIRFTGISRLKK